MEVVGRDCRVIGEVLHTSLSVEERKAIEAARARAGEIADIWLDYHYFGVKWKRDHFSYLMRIAGGDWFTTHYLGDAPWEQRANGSPFPGFSRDQHRRQLRDFIVHATKKTKGGWRFRGRQIIGLGFPIHDNKWARRVLSIDVDYHAIKALKHAWPPGTPEPDWRDPLAKPNLLLVGEAFGRDVEGREQDAELLRELGALVIPGDTGVQAHFYLDGRHKRKELRPLVEALDSVLHGGIDRTNVGTYLGEGKWGNGLPSSLPLPQDRRHLLAFVIDPTIDQFYQGEFTVALDALAEQVAARLDRFRRLSPPSSTGGGSSLAALDASPAAPLLAAPTIKGSNGRRLDPALSRSVAQDSREDNDVSGYNGIHTPEPAASSDDLETADLSIRQAMSRQFLERLDAALAPKGASSKAARSTVAGGGLFPHSLLDARGLIWSFIPSIDPRLTVPPDVLLGTIGEGETDIWLNKGLAHFHSREEFAQAIAGQGDERRKLGRYDWAASHGVKAIHQAAIMPWIDDEFFRQVWNAVLAIEPIREGENAANVAKAMEKRRKQFVIACHGLVSSRCSYDGVIALPVKGSADLLPNTRVNTVAFGRAVLAPIKQAFFEVVCMAWIKEWKKQKDPAPVLVPNEAGRALRELLPAPTRVTYLEYDPCPKKHDAYFYTDDYRSALAAQQSSQAMVSWRRPKTNVKRSA